MAGGTYGCGVGAAAGWQGLGTVAARASMQCPIYVYLRYLLAWGLPCTGGSEPGTAALGLAVGCTHPNIRDPPLPTDGPEAGASATAVPCPQDAPPRGPCGTPQ